MLNWKPPGKKAAICFTIDDIHPSKSTDFYEAGGDLDKGKLGLVKWLLDRHPKLKVTLFTTANWREISPVPTRKLLALTPILRDRFFLAERWKKDKMNLENHPLFIDFLNNWERAEVGFHGLYHIHRGLKIPVEFQNQSAIECKVIIKEMMRIFNKTGLHYVKGICPPGWNAPDPLLDELVKNGFDYVASARDIFTDISKDAKTDMSGIKGEPLIFPSLLKEGKIVHFPTNFQANSTIDRARDIVNNNGLLSIKAHIVKNIFGYTAIDGVDELYMNYLDVLLTNLGNEFGDDLWWSSMGEMAQFIKENN